MKKLLLLASLLALAQNWSRIDAWLNPPTAVQAGEVVLYSTAWCGYCRQTRDLLNARGVRFEERDIEKSEAARREHAALQGRGVPVTVVGEAVIHGYDRRALLEVLR